MGGGPWLPESLKGGKMDVLDTIIARLPGKDILSPADIAAAAGLSSNSAVIAAIREGWLRAVRFAKGGKYLISRADAVDFLRRRLK